MSMRRALLNRGLSAEEFAESPPKADGASFGAAARFYAEDELRRDIIAKNP
jgi:hypothetical protein